MKGLIGWAVIALILVIIANLWIYRRKELWDDPDFSKFGLSVMIIVIAIVSFVTVTMVAQTSSNLYIPVKSDYIDLYALEDNQVTSGTGSVLHYCVKQNQGYTYCYKDPEVGCYIIDNISTEDYKILINDTGECSPRLQYFKYELEKPNAWYSFFLMKDTNSGTDKRKPMVVIYIPEGTMDLVYNIDLE